MTFREACAEYLKWCRLNNRPVRIQELLNWFYLDILPEV